MMATFQELLNNLFDTHRRADGGIYTNLEVSRALDGALHSTHVGKLRGGSIENPARDTILHLCRFFNVEPKYFFPELQDQDINQDAYDLLLVQTASSETFADLLNKLYQHFRRPDGKEYTDRDVSRGIDNALHSSYLGKLRNGQVDNPTRDTIVYLCKFFQVPSDYFFPELRLANNTILLRSLGTNNPEILEAVKRLLQATIKPREDKK